MNRRAKFRVVDQILDAAEFYYQLYCRLIENGRELTPGELKSYEKSVELLQKYGGKDAKKKNRH